MLFHAATIGGAKALMRDDIGRLAADCKADIVAVDLLQPEMMPARDPLRSLIFHAADRAVCDVWVGGRKVPAAGEVLNVDAGRAGATQAPEKATMREQTPKSDKQGRP